MNIKKTYRLFFSIAIILAIFQTYSCKPKVEEEIKVVILAVMTCMLILTISHVLRLLLIA